MCLFSTKRMFLSLLLYCWLALLPGISMAYTITPDELTTLEKNLTQLKSINQTLQNDLKLSSAELKTLQVKLEKVEKSLLSLSGESKLAKSDLEQANKLLKTAKESLKELENEANRLRFERDVSLLALLLKVFGVW